MDEFEGKVAVVTGGASGIGAAMAAAFAARGMKLVLADIEPGPLEETAHALRGDGADVFAVTADVSRAADVERVGQAAIDTFGALHVACNNAGVGSGGATWEVDLSTWEWVLGVNLMGVVHGLRSFTPRIIASGGGHIVNTASMAGLTSPAFMSPYNVSKHAVVTMSESMYVELEMLHPEVGISVLCPGWVQTRINESDRNQPDDVAAAQAAADFAPEDAELLAIARHLGARSDHVAPRPSQATPAGKMLAACIANLAIGDLAAARQSGARWSLCWVAAQPAP